MLMLSNHYPLASGAVSHGFLDQAFWLKRTLGMSDDSVGMPWDIFGRARGLAACEAQSLGPGFLANERHLSPQRNLSPCIAMRLPCLLTRVSIIADNEEEEIRATGRLFLRNLPYTATEADLAELLGEYGQLSEVHLVLDR